MIKIVMVHVTSKIILLLSLTYFYRSFAKTKDETEGGQGPATPWVGAAQPLAAPPGGEATWPTS
jgi:hypothetical protein